MHLVSHDEIDGLNQACNAPDTGLCRPSLVKVAKTAMILNGDGHAGMTHGDSLGSYESLHQVVRARADRGMPTVILTNPPFAGVGEGRITDKRLLDNFACGVKWTERDGKYQRSDEIVDEGVPPEMLFFERCLDWISPGGIVAIVMPKAFLDTQTYQPARELLMAGFTLLGVINCHKNTFQPHTGVRTCLVFLQKPKVGEKPDADYPIFMAVSQRIGQDSEGMPVFRRDDQNKLTDEIDEDLSIILSDYRKFQEGALTPSEYRFSILRSEIDKTACINPQFYLPNLNRTIREIESIDLLLGWSTVSLAEVHPLIQIYKGPRLKSEDIIVETPGVDIEDYLTPSAVLQEKNDSSKLLHLGRASKKQLATIRALRVKRGDLLVTRSGTIGRVAYITKRLDNAIVSDDMIRVRVPDENLRLYVYAFLQSQAGYNQMLRNEYGSVQQHLEPRHLRSLLIPIPDDWSTVQSVIDAVSSAVTAREQLEAANASANDLVAKRIAQLVASALAETTKP
jgi:type I restriction enzyme M protein